ncbi:MAG: GDP-L-fucose synthase [Candidatus Paceibacterota bacterium]|jgi:GDP-L-fucose synthase
MSNYWANKKVIVTGGSGLLGTPLVSLLKQEGAMVLAPKSTDLNLLYKEQVFDYFAKHTDTDFTDKSTVEVVFHLAAKVGGVQGNSQAPFDFYTENIQMNTNVLEAAKYSHIPKVISVLSTCVYPDAAHVTYPLTEDQLHNGPPHSSNYGYAYAKRMLEVQSRAFMEQKSFGHARKSRICVIPNNLFGEHDNFDLENGHVIPALIRKIWEAKVASQPEVIIWGDGTPLREFTCAKDAAKIMLVIAEEYKGKEPLNIGSTEEHSIADVARMIARLLDYKGNLNFDTTKPNGQHRKPSSNAKLLELTSWKVSDYTPFTRALRQTCEWFVAAYPNVRGYK